MTSHDEFPHKVQCRGALMFSLICTLNKRLSKQSWRWWLETPSRSLWRHYIGRGVALQFIDCSWYVRASQHHDVRTEEGNNCNYLLSFPDREHRALGENPNPPIKEQLVGCWLRTERLMVVTRDVSCVIWLKHIEAETTWPPFSRRHFQMYLLEWICMNFG